MKRFRPLQKLTIASLISVSLIVSGCFHSEDENMMPTADASAVASATEMTTVTLTGMGTGDGSLKYSWQQTAGSLAVIKNDDTATASFIVPVVDTGNMSEALTFELTVTDEDGETASDNVTIMVDQDTSIPKYKLSVTNITNGQPLTPVAALLHDATFNAWQIGATASSGLEVLAESGSARAFLSASVNDNTAVIAAALSAGDPIAPGSAKSLVIGGEAAYELTIASMLANTNDAFTGITHWSLADMQINDSDTMLIPVYDAGTEKNTEASGTIAGPADSSTEADKGYSSVRDDPSGFVSMHGGVVTKDDGLSTSVLDESHRWLGAAAKVVITRIQ